MIKTTLHRSLLAALIILLAACGGTRSGLHAHRQEFFSGIFSPDGDTDAEFTDCATRIPMQIEKDGGYERLVSRCGNELPGDRVRGRKIEFYGLTLDGRSDGGTVTEPDGTLSPTPIPVVRIDSLLTIDSEGECTAEYTVPGLYRGEKDGKPLLLRLRPRYTYSLETLTPDIGKALSRGVWYRTSVLTIELEDEITGETVTLQIVPARETLTRTDGGGSEVYVKEWL